MSKPKILGIALLLYGLMGCGTSQPMTNDSVPKIKRQELERAVFFAASNIDGFGDAGYQQWTPTSAATQLVETMNAAQSLTPEEEKEYKERGMPIIKAIPYVLNTPTDKFQVVVVPDEAAQKILIKGYAYDLTEPLIVEEIPCCQF